MGKETIELTKEIPGFVVNRLQGALLIEAFNLVKEGIVLQRKLTKQFQMVLGLDGHLWALFRLFT